MADMKVVFFTNIDAELRQVVADKALPGMDVVTAPADMDDDEKIELVRDADFIMLFPGKISDRVLQAATKCKLIQLLSAGYDEMNLPLAEDLGIAVANNGGANRVAVAEHTLMLMLATHRRMMFYANNVKAGRWKQEQDRKIDVFELEGKTLGLIGMGNIGRQVARRAAAFDMELQYYDKYHPLTPVEEETMGIKAVDMDTLLQTSDVVSTHVPLTRETYGMIGKRELELMKPTGVVINTSRGGVIEETALAEALISGTIAAAGLDVMEHEPPDPNDPLLQIENLVITPHTAGPTLESIPKRAANGFENIQHVWSGQLAMWTAEYENI
ncbi:MAG TPA: lactate dehydrogenase [Dehalococcoidia bacterium]|jgi:glyoxylate reductase/D-3-phosphoglycerate dehydrogenase|nr:lactate dehydrogenase [Dehalococcoidia bacterium]|tara:strand:+ start:207 stop:1190 length:984 start_codon:yes stop_codon:yes gene_type:complete